MEELALWIVGAVIAIALIYILAATSLVFDRHAQPYAEQTRKLTYDTSRQYQQDTNRDVAQYCEQMRTATSPSARKAVVALIRTTTDTIDGDLSADNQACLTEAKGEI